MKMYWADWSPLAHLEARFFLKSIFSSEKLVSYNKIKKKKKKKKKRRRVKTQNFLCDITTAAEALNYINIHWLTNFTKYRNLEVFPPIFPKKISE
jgi:ribonuclease HI